MPRQPAVRVDGEYPIPSPYGGMNTRVHATKIPPASSVMLKNLELSEELGVWKSRRGTTAYNSALFNTTNEVRGGHRFYYGSSKKLVVASGTKLWLGDDTLGTFSSIKTGLTDDRDWYFAQNLDILYGVNGSNAMQRYDGTTVRDAGFPNPPTPIVGAAGAAGVLTGSYEYKCTFVYDSNAAHESSNNTVSNTVSVTAQKVNLSSIPVGSGGSGVTARNIYRRLSSGDVFYFLTTISDNVTTTYVDNIADVDLGDDTEPTDNGIPPAGKFVLFWRGRMVVLGTVANPQRAYFSSVTSSEVSPGGGQTVHGAGPEIFPADHFIDIGEDNAPLTGGCILNDHLVIFKEGRVYNIQGDDAQDMVVWSADGATGCSAPKTIVNMGRTIFYLGRTDGRPEVYSYDGMTAEPVSVAIEPTLKANVKDLGDTTLQPMQPCAGRYKGQYILSYAKVGGGGLFETAVFDTRPPARRWVLWDKIEAGCFISWNGGSDQGEMYYGVQNESRVLRLDNGTTDYAASPTAIATTIKTGFMDIGYPYQWKQIKKIEIFSKADAATTITVTRYYDFKTSGTTAGASATTLAAISASNDVAKIIVDGQGSDATFEDQGYRMQLEITASGALEITDIIVWYAADPPGFRHDSTA